QTAQMTCYAGTAGGVIYDEGTVSSCENLAPIGNLRDFDWDFQKLWLSPAMKERRKKALDGCFCTHESNSYYPSLPFNPGHLIQIKKLEKEMKKARKEMDRLQPEPEGMTVRACSVGAVPRVRPTPGSSSTQRADTQVRPYIAISMSQRIPKILILSSDTGGGHRSAAAAIVAGVQKFFDG